MVEREREAVTWGVGGVSGIPVLTERPTSLFPPIHLNLPSNSNIWTVGLNHVKLLEVFLTWTMFVHSVSLFCLFLRYGCLEIGTNSF